MGQYDRRMVENVEDRFHLHADRSHVMETYDEADGRALVPERHRDTAPCLCLGFQGWWQGVGEESRKGDGKHYVSEVGQGD